MVAIAGILVALAVPNFNAYIGNTRVKTAAQELFLAMVEARSEAIKRNDNVSVVAVTLSGTQAWANGWEIQNSGGTVIQKHAALDGVTVTEDPTGTFTVTYARSGRLSGSAPTLTLCDLKLYATKREVTVSTTGRPSIDQVGDC